ncbi:MAG: 6,7-dimethyl-8-ribityllumazine synthase [Alphaproteobacteria bacterium]|nr:6,7-dimethyl-8-ribityllumazine synthase [Alphaproteobacteria bacterium]
MKKKVSPSDIKFKDAPHIMIVEGRFYDDIADLQLKGAKAVLDRVGASYVVHTVPGAFEIPPAIMYAVRSLNFDAVRRRFDGYIALGCVIQGQTKHADIIAHESARGLQDLSLTHALAIGNGILTVNTHEQAEERADPARLDRGGAAAEACLKMVELKQIFNLSPKRRWVAR